MQSKQTVQVALLTLAAVGLLAVIFYTPIWWVSLTAPNYPAESFPDGVRIHFHMNGVFNGCKKQQKTEIVEEEALDCVHEMDTINHYVGMYPIAAGGPLERGFSQFLMALLAVMLLGFVCTRPKLRLSIMAAGFAGIALWMTLTLYVEDGFKLQNQGYVNAMVTSLDQEASAESAASDESHHRRHRRRAQTLPGGIRGQGGTALGDRAPPGPGSGHGQRTFDRATRATYDIDQAKSAELSPWNGSTFQVMSWHYAKSLGRYFNNPAEITPMVAKLELAMHVIFFALLGVDAAVAVRCAQKRWAVLLAAGAGADGLARVVRDRLFRLALVVWPYLERYGRLFGETFHADRIRRRQGGPVHHPFLSLHRIRPDAAVLSAAGRRRPDPGETVQGRQANLANALSASV